MHDKWLCVRNTANCDEKGGGRWISGSVSDGGGRVGSAAVTANVMRIEWICCFPTNHCTGTVLDVNLDSFFIRIIAFVFVFNCV